MHLNMPNCPDRLYHRVRTIHSPLHLAYFVTYMMEGGYTKLGLGLGFVLITIFEIWHDGSVED